MNLRRGPSVYIGTVAELEHICTNKQQARWNRVENCRHDRTENRKRPELIANYLCLPFAPQQYATSASPGHSSRLDKGNSSVAEVHARIAHVCFFPAETNCTTGSEPLEHRTEPLGATKGAQAGATWFTLLPMVPSPSWPAGNKRIDADQYEPSVKQSKRHNYE